MLTLNFVSVIKQIKLRKVFFKIRCLNDASLIWENGKIK